MKIQDIKNKCFLGDNLEVMKQFPNNCIDSIITDPPYDLESIFSEMPNNKKWEHRIPSVKHFKEMLRIIKPGVTILCFGATRCFHRVAVNMEDAGWYINDCLGWLYGQGFPKSVDISYIIDKVRGTFGDIKEIRKVSPGRLLGKKKSIKITDPGCEESKKWHGWGTMLKPAWEPILVANKHIDGNYDDNAIKWGVAGLWIDGIRIGNENFGIKRTSDGRYPSNIIFDESIKKWVESESKRIGKDLTRFFYCVKTRRKSKDEHPTKKPVELMEYLCNMTKTPDGGIVLDPYGGEFSTAIACLNTGRDYIIIEKDEYYFNRGQKRIKENKVKKGFFN